MQREIKTTYPEGFKYLHWILAILIVMMLSFGFFLGELPAAYKATAYMLHKSMGLSILALMLIRGIWILVHGKPKLPKTVPWWERKLAGLVQAGLYIFVISMAFSGWIMATASRKVPVFFGLFEIPFPGLSQDLELARFMNSSHKTIAWVLIGLISLHVAGALKHWLIQKDDLIKRMMP